MTDKDLYIKFLSLVNKTSNHTIIPSEFNIIINSAAMNWINSLLPKNEFSQSLIDDLSLFLVATDDLKKDSSSWVFGFALPDDYLHGNRAEVKLTYLNSDCYDDGESEGFVPASLLKSDRVSAVMSSYYLRPKDDRIKVRYIGRTLRILTGYASGLSDTFPTKCMLEYYRYPEVINFEEGKVKELEFSRKQSLSIVEMAAQEFLEMNRDPRYQSFLNEQNLKNRI